MDLAQSQLGRVFARDDSLVGGDEPGQDVEQRRLAGAGATRDDDVQPGLHRRVEIFEDPFARAAGGHDLLRGQHLAAELADRQARAVDRDRWDDDVHARAVLQSRIAHRLRLIHAPSDRRDDPVDDAPQAGLVLEGEVGQLDPAASLDEDLLRPVDHDLGDVRVAQRRLQRTEPDDLVEEDLDQALPVGRGDERGRGLEPEVLFGQLHEEPPDARAVGDVDRRGVPSQEVGMDLRLGGGQRGAEHGRALDARRLHHGDRPLSRHRPPLHRGDAGHPVDRRLRSGDGGLRSGDGGLRPGDRGLRRGCRRLLVAAVEPLGKLHRGLLTARRRRRR